MFLANENFPRPSVLFLRGQGIPVKSIQELHSGLPDDAVINLAKDEELIILTLDRDYGELIFRYAMEHPPAVVYFRNKGKGPEFVGRQLHFLLSEEKIDFSNAFTVVDDTSIRQRHYQKKPE
jgi:predicted nuclease of predicted toxin-antitoxin system